MCKLSLSLRRVTMKFITESFAKIISSLSQMINDVYIFYKENERKKYRLKVNYGEEVNVIELNCTRKCAINQANEFCQHEGADSVVLEMIVGRESLLVYTAESRVISQQCAG